MKSKWMKLVVLALVVTVVVLVFKFTPLDPSDFKPDRIKDFILARGVWGPVIFIVIYSLRAVILVMPVGVMSLAGGYAYGPGLGTLYILIGATLGSCLSFLMARYVGREFLENMKFMKSDKMSMFDQGTENNGLKLILFMRLVPLFQYDAVNFGAGFSKMKFRDFALGSFVGMIPGGFINAYLGSSLENPLSIQFLVAIGFFVLLMFIPAIYKKIKAGKEEKSEVKEAKGVCPECGKKIGPMAWLHYHNAGHFVCPSCNAPIHWQRWLLAVILLILFLAGINALLVTSFRVGIPGWIGYIIAFVLGLGVMMIVPRFWKFEKG